MHETNLWLERVVIDLNLCPFARSEWESGKVRVHVTKSSTPHELLKSLIAELNYLLNHDKIETTLLCHPSVLTEFEDYNQFLDSVDAVLVEMSLEGVVQIASFHPDYQFYGTDSLDLENFTNRSPYPMLHLLREDSLEAAIERHPDAEGIPEKNLKRLNDLGLETVRALIAGCK